MEADAATWLVERITAALDEAERAGQEAVRRGRTARDSNSPQGFYPARLREAKLKAMDEARVRGARTIAGPLFQTATIRALPHLADKPTRRNHL